MVGDRIHRFRGNYSIPKTKADQWLQEIMPAKFIASK